MRVAVAQMPVAWTADENTETIRLPCDRAALEIVSITQD